MVVTFKDLCRIVSLHPGASPGLLVGVPRAAIREMRDKAKKSKLYTNAQPIKTATSSLDDDWEDEITPLNKRAVCPLSTLSGFCAH